MKFLLIFLCGLVSCLSSQVWAQNKLKAGKEQQFISQYLNVSENTVNEKKEILYADALYNGEVTAFAVAVKKDTLFDFAKKNKYLILTKSEKEDIQTELAKISEQRWPDGIIQHSSKLSLDSLKGIIGPQGLGWNDNYYKKYKTGFYTLSKPVFIRNETICFFYAGYHCGNLCGHGSVAVYLFNKGKWEKWLVLEEWRS
ncbi:hypothetical protein GS399_03125 [Pedobacter sp. HMF7647]|uniref:Uncharacterized protein n=1 Tax=Hufsiella arboris TaxID=2695275 RepID=A0A7K1Y683_9SPHI|nr:hypothetical protein [Hufsiella arboris]MXV49950.1 hypothetical protein [Hufsiella arboris]